jgi:hypothetical protein
MQLTIPQPQRPTMRDYGIASSTDGLLDWAWVSAEMHKSRNYWISTTRPDGRPHASPVWGVVLDDVLYFASSKRSVKGRNLAHNSQVVAHLESGDDCVIVEGAVFPLDDEALLGRMATAYGKKYAPFTPTPEELHGGNNVAYGVAPKIVMAWKENDFPNTATRWVFDE